MATVSNIMIKFGETGADNVERANKRVGRSITGVAKTAHKEERKISGWIQRHKTAMLGMGAAMAGVLYGIAKASPSMSASLDSIRMAFSFLAMQIGEDVAPALEWVEGIAWKIADAYAELPEPVRQAISVIVVALAGLGVALAAVTVKQMIFNAAVLANPYVIIAAAIIALIAIVWKLETAYGETGRTINTYLIPILFGLVGWLYVLETRFGMLSGAWDRIKPVLQAMYNALVTVVTFVRDTAVRAVEVFLDIWNRVWNTIKSIVATVILTIYYLLTGQFDKIGELWGKFADKMRAIWGDLWDRVVDTLRAFGRRIVQGIQTLINRFWELLVYVIDPRNWGEIATKLLEAGRNMVESILRGIGNIGAKIWNWIVDKMRGFVNNIVAWAKGEMGMSPTLFEIGQEIVMSIIKGIGNIGVKIWDAIAGGLSDIGGKITGWTKDGLKWGADLMDNFTKGIKDSAGKVADAASGALEGAKNFLSFDNPANDRMAFKWGTHIIDHVSKGIRANIPKIEAAARGAIDVTMQPFESPMPAVMAAPTPTPQAAGQSVNVTIETGAIQITGVDETIDEERLAEIIAREFGGRVGGR